MKRLLFILSVSLLCSGMIIAGMESCTAGTGTEKEKAVSGPPEITEYAAVGDASDLAFLLERGADTETRDADGRTLLMIALGAQNYGNAQLLLKHGADVNASAYHHVTSLMIAVDEDRTETVQFLLKHGAALEKEDDFGNTALVHSVMQKRPGALRELLRAGANVNVRFVRKLPVLLEAVVQPDPEILRLLLSAPALDLEVCDPMRRNALLSLLHWQLLTGAADNGAAKLLLERGINVDHADKDGRTALMFAAGLGNQKLLQDLLRRGADKRLRDRKNHTALDYCKDPECRKLLQ